VVTSGVNKIMETSTARPAVVVITHYNRILDYLKPDVVHVLGRGQMLKSGGPELARELEERGYDWILEQS
ncbi:MAG: Fe-S cluster assembly ATPase SufC, partial [Prosthecobacter sp.]|nr:Fe-S cluster assembly ATPase SufC [Prosthecobacter sp.]